MVAVLVTDCFQEIFFICCSRGCGCFYPQLRQGAARKEVSLNVTALMSLLSCHNQSTTEGFGSAPPTRTIFRADFFPLYLCLSQASAVEMELVPGKVLVLITLFCCAPLWKRTSLLMMNHTWYSEFSVLVSVAVSCSWTWLKGREEVWRSWSHTSLGVLIWQTVSTARLLTSNWRDRLEPRLQNKNISKKVLLSLNFYVM